MSERGRYIVIEGSDGTGKSTQAGRLYHHLAYIGIHMCGFMVEEPDGAYEIEPFEALSCASWSDDIKHERGLVPGATALRKIVKDKDMRCDTDTNILLFTAARKLNWEQAINPALERGLTVVTARSWLSTLAYQGFAEGGDKQYIEEITRATAGEQYMQPDVELILTSNDEAARQQRMEKRGSDVTADAFESRNASFQDALQLGYAALAASRGIHTIEVPAGNSLDMVENAIWKYVGSGRS